MGGQLKSHGQHFIGRTRVGGDSLVEIETFLKCNFHMEFPEQTGNSRT